MDNTGKLYFNYADNSYTTFTKTEGLNGSPVTAVAVDNQNKIWFDSSILVIKLASDN